MDAGTGSNGRAYRGRAQLHGDAVAVVAVKQRPWEPCPDCWAMPWLGESHKPTCAFAPEPKQARRERWGRMILAALVTVAAMAAWVLLMSVLAF